MIENKELGDAQQRNEKVMRGITKNQITNQRRGIINAILDGLNDEAPLPAVTVGSAAGAEVGDGPSEPGPSAGLTPVETVGTLPGA